MEILPHFGPEAEFFIFDDVRYRTTANESFYQVDSEEGIWGSGSEDYPNQGYKIRHKEGYLPVLLGDKQMDLRNEMVLTMQDIGLEVECQHHEVATGGQAEIDLRFDTLLAMGDALCKYKYVVKNVAYRNGKSATFMPKPYLKITDQECTLTYPSGKERHLFSPEMNTPG